jgi:hypothetical protein
MLERIAANDAEMMTVLAAIFAGPDTIESDVVDPTLLDRIRNAS